MKLSGGRDNGDGGTHEPSGQWKVVPTPRVSILPNGHTDLDEAKDRFRRVREPPLRISQPCVTEANASDAVRMLYGSNFNTATYSWALKHTTVVV